MKKLILFILGAISALAPTLAQQPELESPIYIGALIIEMSDTARMARTCRDYGLTELPASPDGYRTFRYHDGTTISFTLAPATTAKRPTSTGPGKPSGSSATRLGSTATLPDAGDPEMLPIVEIRTNESSAAIKKILEQTSFVRSGKASGSDGSTSGPAGITYERGAITYERGNKFTSRWTRATLTPHRLLLTRHLPTI